MHYWVLDTSDENLLLCSKKDSDEFFLKLPPETKCSQQLSSLLKKLLHKRGKPEIIAVGNGPGMFTGVRLGVMAAKTLSYAWKVPLIPFCSLKKYLPIEPGAFAVIRTADREHAYYLEGSLSKEKKLSWNIAAEKKPLTSLQNSLIPLIGHHRFLSNTIDYRIGLDGVLPQLKNAFTIPHDRLQIEYLHQP